MRSSKVAGAALSATTWATVSVAISASWCRDAPPDWRLSRLLLLGGVGCRAGLFGAVGGGAGQLLAQLALRLGVLDDLAQQRVEFVVAVELGQQVTQTLARLEQPVQRRNLLDH